MRAVFLLLVLANVVVLAYAHLGHETGAAERQILVLQVSPEKIRPLRDSAERGPARAPAKTATAGPRACIEWGEFAGPDMARADSALARLELPSAQIGRTVSDAGGYWVFMPPLKTKAEVDRKIGELKALGVTEFFVVQETNQWRNAISLGIFRNEDAAKAFLAKLRERGVRSAVLERRESFLKQLAFYVRDPNDATVAKLAELQKEFPGSELKAVPCPAAEAAKG